jgi:K+-transporting ATPase KdpF subunit
MPFSGSTENPKPNYLEPGRNTGIVVAPEPRIVAGALDASTQGENRWMRFLSGLRLASSSWPQSIFSPAIGCEDDMSFDLVFGGIIAVGILIYLTLALLWPERF